MTRKDDRTLANPGDPERRKGVRRTVLILVSVVLVFFAISFLQIVLIK